MLSFVCSTTRTAGICTGRFALFGVVLSKAYILLVIITLFKNSIHLSLSLWGLTGASWRVVTNELSHTKKSDNTGEHTKSKTPYALLLVTPFKVTLAPRQAQRRTSLAVRSARSHIARLSLCRRLSCTSGRSAPGPTCLGGQKPRVTGKMRQLPPPSGRGISVGGRPIGGPDVPPGTLGVRSRPRRATGRALQRCRSRARALPSRLKRLGAVCGVTKRALLSADEKAAARPLVAGQLAKGSSRARHACE